MNRTTRRLVAAALAVSFGALNTGCFGSFTLVRKLYTWNSQVSSDKFIRAIVFWVLVIIPIYQFCSFADVVILNLIEFWTGRNPLTMRDGETQQRIVEANGQKATMTFADRGQSVRIEITRPGMAPQVFEFRGSESSAELRDGTGRVLSAGLTTASGGVEVADAEGTVVLRRDDRELTDLAALENPDALLSALRPGSDTRVCSLP